jgi:hypothetical protein
MKIEHAKNLIDETIFNINLKIEKQKIVNDFHKLLFQMEKIKSYMERQIMSSRIPLVATLSIKPLSKNTQIIFIYWNFDIPNIDFDNTIYTFTIGSNSIVHSLLKSMGEWAIFKYFLIIQHFSSENQYSISIHDNNLTIHFHPEIYVGLMDREKSILLYQCGFSSDDKNDNFFEGGSSYKEYYMKILKSKSTLKWTESRLPAYIQKIGLKLFNSAFNNLKTDIEKYIKIHRIDF